MSMLIRAGDLHVDDVIEIAGEHWKVIDAARYRKQNRLWVNLTLLLGPDEHGTSMDRAFPVEVLVPWRGSALF